MTSSSKCFTLSTICNYDRHFENLGTISSKKPTKIAKAQEYTNEGNYLQKLIFCFLHPQNIWHRYPHLASLPLPRKPKQTLGAPLDPVLVCGDVAISVPPSNYNFEVHKPELNIEQLSSRYTIFYHDC